MRKRSFPNAANVLLLFEIASEQMAQRTLVSSVSEAFCTFASSATLAWRLYS